MAKRRKSPDLSDVDIDLIDLTPNRRQDSSWTLAVYYYAQRYNLTYRQAEILLEATNNKNWKETASRRLTGRRSYQLRSDPNVEISYRQYIEHVRKKKKRPEDGSERWGSWYQQTFEGEDAVERLIFFRKVLRSNQPIWLIGFGLTDDYLGGQVHEWRSIHGAKMNGEVSDNDIRHWFMKMFIEIEMAVLRWKDF